VTERCAAYAGTGKWPFRNCERVFIIPGSRVKNGDDRLVVLNRVALSVVEVRRGIDPTYVFTYEGRPIRRMLTSGWIQARTRAHLPQVRVLGHIGASV
jgi:hypothetical protein